MQLRRERFAPSPTGLLHLGHAYSAMCAWSEARSARGQFLLRIEDIDTARSRQVYETAIYEDLAWLGLDWTYPVVRQSSRIIEYRQAIETLVNAGLCYPCKCSRRDIRNALSAPHGNDIRHHEKTVYPGTCRNRDMGDIGNSEAIRLNMRRAIALLGGSREVEKLGYNELGQRHSGLHKIDCEQLLHGIGDIILARGNVATSYHLSVVVDDAFMSVTHVTRGEDLFEFTGLHRLLQELLRLPVPEWNHHMLIRDSSGNRLAKRDDARSIRTYRNAGMQPHDILAMLKERADHTPWV